MQLRLHPKMIGRWPPKRLVSGSYTGADASMTIEQLSESAVMHRVADCPPLPPSSDVQGVILYTDRGSGAIVASDAIFRGYLFQQLQACLGLSVREIGDVDIDFDDA